jgi:hypothetical protein
MKGLNEMDMDMDIMEIVDMMEEAIEKASAVPLTGKVMIDKGELLDYIQEIRLVYPDELKEAKWVKEERQRILSEAENRAEAIQKNAEETQMQLIDEHEITKAAYEQANELVNAAQQKSIEIKTNMLMMFLTTLNTDWTCYLEKFVRTEVISIITD